MMRLHEVRIFALAGVFAACAASGCGQVDADTPDPANAFQREQAVSVVPEFSVTGTSALPDKLVLSNLGLTISEIRLEPLTGESDSIAYSARNATRLHFDIAGGETVKLGDPVELPAAGRYLVSVRLKPISEVVHSEEGSSEAVTPSLSLSGFVASQGGEAIDPRYDSTRTDGRPIPLPYDRDSSDDGENSMQDAPEIPSGWTPFRYHSQRSVFFTLNEVELSAGEQVLSFEFDVQDWALELVDPLLNAVEHAPDVGSWRDEEIDVTSPLESTGHGATSLFENVEARTTTQGTRGR